MVELSIEPLPVALAGVALGLAVGLLGDGAEAGMELRGKCKKGFDLSDALCEERLGNTRGKVKILYISIYDTSLFCFDDIFFVDL